jgi:hypothetical protein
MAFETELVHTPAKQLLMPRRVGHMAGHAFAFGNRRMDVFILEPLRVVTGKAKRGNRSHKKLL